MRRFAIVFVLVPNPKEGVVTSTRRELIRGGVLLAAAGAMTKFARAQAISPSPEWSRAMPSAPVAGTKITEAYAALVARDAFLWGWPLVNVYNRA